MLSNISGTALAPLGRPQLRLTTMYPDFHTMVALESDAGRSNTQLSPIPDLMAAVVVEALRSLVDGGQSYRILISLSQQATRPNCAVLSCEAIRHCYLSVSSGKSFQKPG
jgi:hypothetical protein